MRLLGNALSAGKQDMPRGGTENNIATNTTRRTTGRIKFCFIHHVQWLTRTIKTNGSEHSDLSMDDVTQLFPQLSVGRRFTKNDQDAPPLAVGRNERSRGWARCPRQDAVESVLGFQVLKAPPLAAG